jgi:decaprenyl-phosphate phosphoribosyltransferase
MKSYIKLARPKHWIKNLLIFLPLCCSLMFSKINVINSIIGFFSFCFMASFIYTINDINDVEKDKLHPKKKERPIASGKVSIKNAKIFAIILLTLSFVLNYFATKNILSSSFAFLIAYCLINISYSMGLKNIAILDVILLASGFIIRVYYGASLINVPVSSWLFLTILNASLFMGFGKRKKEFQLKKDVRKVLKNYNEQFLTNFMNVNLTLIIVFYSLWAIEQHKDHLFLSIPILMTILMVYELDLDSSDEGDPTSVLYHNKILIFLSLIFVLFVAYALLLG